MSERVFIGLGANLGDCTKAVLEAFERLDSQPEVALRQVSTLLRSAPVDVVDQPSFINAVAEVATTRSPASLLDVLLRVESDMGRARQGAVPRGPRVIDLDILLWGDRVIDSDGLCIPHPRMHLRAFVLVPMVELDETVVHPVLQADMATLLTREIELHGPLTDRIGLVQPDALTSE